MLSDNINKEKGGDFESFESMTELDELIANHLPDEESELTTEKLLEPSRITISYENIVKDAGLKTFMTANVNVEPFEIKLGFRELEFFS